MLHPAAEFLPIAAGFAGVGAGEARDRVSKALVGTDVSGDDGCVAASGVAAGEDLATEAGVAVQRGGVGGLEVKPPFVVVELADEVVATVDGCVAEERVRHQLHHALAVHDPFALLR